MDLISKERVEERRDIREVEYETQIEFHKAEERVEICLSTSSLATTKDSTRTC